MTLTAEGHGDVHKRHVPIYEEQYSDKTPTLLGPHMAGL